ncbi:MAG: hypothetical protein LUD81_06955 [Clostridiales bacterium]|nr:hypothetical protein [Clostridiales bacterium]
MSRIPNCRTDEYYNEKYLGKDDKRFVSGYDYAAEIIGLLFSNLDVYYRDFDIKGEDINLARFLENHPKITDKAEEAVKNWLEMQRNEFITGMLDSMDDDEYEKIKFEVDSEEE